MTSSEGAPLDPAQAKEPRTRLAGPYGHPFHPILVTVPIGAWVASLSFDLASRWTAEPEVFAKGSFWLIIGGLAGAAGAAAFGVMDLLTIPRGTPASRTALAHAGLNTAAITLYIASLLVRREHLDEGDVTAAGLTTSVVALAMLGMSGWLGGKLTYLYGVRVARESTQAEGFRRTS